MAALGWIVAGALAALTPVAAAADAAGLAGAWTATEAVRDGAPAADVVGHRLSVAGDRFEIVAADGAALYAGRVGVDPAATPAAVDFVVEAGPAAGRTWLGVWRTDGVTLTIVDNAPDPSQPRPTAFDAPAGSGYVLVVFARDD